MNNLRLIFYIFIFLSIFLFVSGAYSGYSLANLEKTRTVLINSNPQNVSFRVYFNNTSYVPNIKFTLVNPGHMKFTVEQITWHVFLVNGSVKHQANNYVYFFFNNKVFLPPGGHKRISIIDNLTTHIWQSYILSQVRWLSKKYGCNNVTWYTTLDIRGFVGDYNTEQYRYNVRTWYLWNLPAVELSYYGYS